MTEVILFILLIVFAIIYTRARKTKIGDIDSFLDLKWLFPKRAHKITYDDINHLIAKRGVCGNFGKVSPWTHKPCRCKGYTFKQMKRGTPYCECGCQMLGHRFKTPAQPVHNDEE